MPRLKAKFELRPFPRAGPSTHARATRRPSNPRPRASEARAGRKERRPHRLSQSEGSFGSICRDRQTHRTGAGRPPPLSKPAWKMGRRLATTQMGAPLTAQSIEIKALKIGDDRENRGIKR